MKCTKQNNNFLKQKHRFPCTDLRPIHTPDRVPWWKRNVLRDSLYINFYEAKLSYQSNRYEIVANKIDIYYSVSDSDKEIEINKHHLQLFVLFFSNRKTKRSKKFILEML